MVHPKLLGSLCGFALQANKIQPKERRQKRPEERKQVKGFFPNLNFASVSKICPILVEKTKFLSMIKLARGTKTFSSHLNPKLCRSCRNPFDYCRVILLQITLFFPVIGEIRSILMGICLSLVLHRGIFL